MKKTILLGVALAAFFPLTSSATANEKYPASDFQPTVIYIDKTAATEAEAETDAADPKYPAANFQPKIVYSDSGLTEQTQAQEEKDEFDAKYPAAYFKPKVIYP